MKLSIVFAALVALTTAMPALAGTRVVMQTTKGDITLELADEEAPGSVANFVGYANNGAYDGTVFHRVIDGFMVQGGGFDTQYQRRETSDPIDNEADNGLTNARGTIAMARTSAPHSATNQFFINVADNSFLDHKDKSPTGWGYAVFGRVVDGMDVVDAIRQVPTGAGGPFPKDVPRDPVVIEKVTILSE